MRTARAPKATALSTSVPRRTPPSRRTLVELSIASTTPVKAWSVENGVVQLTPAMIVDDDADRADSRSDPSVIGPQYSLDYNRKGRAADQPFHIPPADVWVKEVVNVLRQL
jgi:hypothetical protein